MEGYRQQDIVIINEFRGQIPYSELLDLIDKWPKTVKRRNREPVPFTSKHVIITSSLHPKDVYKNLSQTDKMDQLYRRIILHKLDYIEFEKTQNNPKVVEWESYATLPLDPPTTPKWKNWLEDTN